MSTSFYKLHGAGNDFIFFVNTPAQPELAAAFCHRHTGLGADGVVWLNHLGEKRFRWDFFNSDGSPAEMCGNAARCAVRLVEKVFSFKTMELETRAGIVYGEVESGSAPTVAVSFDIASTPLQEIANPVGADFPKGYLLTTGVPHCVIPTARPHELGARAKEFASFLKNKAFGPHGANLTFADMQSHPVRTVTLERGVEDFTLACGTGVIATAKVHQHLYKKNEPLKLQAPGGAFTVFFAGHRATLSGPAEFVFKGEI